MQMKKRVTVILEVESDDDVYISDEFIRGDLETEINCTTNYYDVISIQTEVLDKQGSTHEMNSKNGEKHEVVIDEDTFRIMLDTFKKEIKEKIPIPNRIITRNHCLTITKNKDS